MASIHTKKLGSGRVIWELTHGKSPRIRFKAGDTKEEAEATLALFKRQIARHGEAPEGLIIREAYLRYSEFLDLNRSPSTARRYTRVIQTFGRCFLPQFHPKVSLLRDIKPSHIEDYKRRRVLGEIEESEEIEVEDAERDDTLRQELADNPVSGSAKANAKYGFLGRKRLQKAVTKSTINFEIRVLGTFFLWCNRQNYLFLNPVEGVEKFRLPKRSLPKFMTKEELQEFFAACSAWERRIFTIMLLTGMRKGEMEHLEWSDVRLDLGLIFIQAKEADDTRPAWQPKTDERVIPIPHALHAVFAEHFDERRSDRFICANQKGNPDTHLLGKVKKICRKAGIQPQAATVHALRHSFGAHLRMSGVPLANIADLMGHSDLATTQIYAKVQIEHLREAINQLAPLVPSSLAPAVSLKGVTRGNRELVTPPNSLKTNNL